VRERAAGADPGPGPAAAGRLPRAIQLAAGLALAEAAGFVVYGVALVVQAARGDRSSVQNVALLVVLVVGWGAGLVFAARGLLGRRRWSRAPLVVSQLLLVAVGLPLAEGPVARWAGVALVAASVLAVGALLTPAVTGALEG
jgi:hypothetical protein